MTIFSKSGLAGLFMAAAAIILPVSNADARYSYSTSGSSHNGQRSFDINLLDENGSPIRYSLVAPEDDPAQFRADAEDILKRYVATFDMDLDDRDAGGFVWMLGYLAEKMGITTQELVWTVGLTEDQYNSYVYQAERNEVLESYTYLKNFDQPDMFFGQSIFTTGDEDLEEINQKIKAAREKYPDDPAFDVPDLTGDDLLRARRKYAELLVNEGMKAVEAAERGDPAVMQYAGTAKDIVHLLYVALQAPADDPDNYFSSGAKYNKAFPQMVDDILAKKGCTGACRDAFYTTLIELRNHVDLTSTVNPVPPGARTPEP